MLDRLLPRLIIFFIIFSPSAEVCGLVLNHLKDKHDPDLKSCEEIVIQKLKQLNQIPGAKSHEKFFHCLYMCYQQYSDIVLHFGKNYFVYKLAEFENRDTLEKAMIMMEGKLLFRIKRYITDTMYDFS